MSTQTEDRIEVGQCDMGYVFIFHKAKQDGRTGAACEDAWMVRAGNHTVGTYDTEDAANAIARALVGDDRLNVAFEAPVETVAIKDLPLTPTPKTAKK